MMPNDHGPTQRAAASLPMFLRGGDDDGVAPLLQRRAGRPDEALALLADPELRNAVRDALDARLPREFLDPFAPARERNAQVIAVLREAIVAARTNGGPLAGVPSDIDTLLALYAASVGWGPIQKYLDDPRVNEVKIAGTAVLVQENGQEFALVPERFASAEDVARRARFIADTLRVRLDERRPQTTLPLAHGTRMHVTLPPLADGGALICIRRGRTAAWDLADLEQRQTVSAPLAELLRLFVRAGCSFLVAGATGSGKTAILEALANSLTGDVHILTIEDLTREIQIRRAELWTRELIDTSQDPGAFAQAAKEALRQTPGYLIPGETRADEAGAILSMAMSDRPVMTSMHAQDARRAVERFASYAALPGSYLYAGRRDDALRDAVCGGFDVVIYAEQIAGRRLVSEVALPCGVTADASGRLTPTLVPLATMSIDDGEPRWAIHARATDDGRLAWESGPGTPPSLDRKLRNAHLAAKLASARPSVSDLAETVRRARQAMGAGEPERAINVMRPAWTRSRDTTLLDLTRSAMALAPAQYDSVVVHGQTVMRALAARLAARQWLRAQQQFEHITADLAYAAAAEPSGGWQTIAGCIRDGMVTEADTRRAVERASAEIDAGRPWAALDLLAACELDRLADDATLLVVRARERAQELLVARGEGSPDVLLTLTDRRAALERAAAHPEVLQ